MKNSNSRIIPAWYRLDNTAKIYPATKSKTRSNVFRLSVVLKEEVNPVLLSQALRNVIKRFPCFSVRMRRGFFWYYLEQNPRIPEIKPDTENACIRIEWDDNNGFLFRVLHYNRTISLECFHAITDGSGGMEFLKALCAEYLRIKGYKIEKSQSIIDIDEVPSIEEVKDSFIKYAVNGKLIFNKEKKAYRILGTFEPPGKNHIITGILKVDEVLKAAHLMNASITEYLVAVLVFTLYDHQRKNSLFKILPVKVSVPINLRNHFKSNTLRNFTLSISTGIDPNLGEYTLDEIVPLVHHFMRYSITEKFLRAQMSSNVSAEKNKLLRIIPLVFKNKGLSVALNKFHDSRISSTLSNIGRIIIPNSMSEHIERFEGMSNPSKMKPVNCVVVSHLNTLVINFTRAIAESDIEREFFRILVRQGLHVKIESNDSQ